MTRNLGIVLTGVAIGLLALLLGAAGNPANMGVCVACFLRDVAGALKLHAVAPVQYLRPEIPGFALGAFAAALAFREFAPKAGSAPLTRCLLGFFMMLGCLVFLGCPLRMVLRIAGGDGNALVGLAGFVLGIAIGAGFLKRNFSLPPQRDLPKRDGVWFALIAAVLLALFLAAGSLFAASASGPGAAHAPLWLSLVAGGIIGALVQRTRFCFIGMVSRPLLLKQYGMPLGVLALTAAVWLGNLALGKFSPGFAGQPIAHADALWNFLSMLLVGWIGAYLGGCPLRQLVAAGQGDHDAAMTVVGMLLGAAAAHNFALASSPAGPTPGGKVMVLAGLVLVVVIGALNIRRSPAV